MHTLIYSPQYNDTKKNKMQPLSGWENRYTNTEERGQRGINDCVENGEGIQEVFIKVFEGGYSQLRGVSV